MLDKVFKRVAIVQMLALFMAVVGMLIDSIIIGQFLGEVAMGAYGLVAPVLTLFAAIGGTLATGAQTVSSKALGQGNTKKANKYLSAAMFIGLVVSLAVMILLIVLAEPIALGLGAGKSAELTTKTVDYIRGYVLGAPGLILLLIGLPFMQLDSDRNSAIIGALLMTIGDIALDLVNVHFVKGGMFGMGAASAISVYMALVVLFIHFARKKYVFHISFRKLEWKAIPEIVQTGLPYAVTQVCRTILVMTLNHLILGISGESGLAAYSVVNTVFNVLCIPGSAIGTASVMMSSIMTAERNRSGLEEIMKAFIKYAVIYNVIVAAIALLFAKPVVAVFLSSSSDETLEMAVMGAKFIGVSMILAGVNCGFRNYFQGIGKMKITQLLTVGSTYVFLVIPALLLSPAMGINGIWLSYILTDVIVLVLLFLAAAVKKGTIPRKIKDFDFLDEKFGIPKENLREYEIQTKEDVMKASREISDFCKAHGASLQTRMGVSLAIEEMGNNVVEHALSKKKKGHFQIRVFCEERKWTVSMRDDCIAFNPKEYSQLHEDEDRTKNIGIRLIVGIAQSVKYINTLELNNLIIELEDKA